MLNFLCVNIEVLIEDAFSVFGGFIAVVIGIIAIISKAKKQSSTVDTTTDDDNDYPFGHPNDTGKLTPEQRRYQNQLKQRQSAKKPTAETHGDGHTHTGTAETYDPIVGSLGAVSDEGCDELNGVRLIVNDIRYETDDCETAYDMDAIRKSLILGEILNNPRFKHPYGRK